MIRRMPVLRQHNVLKPLRNSMYGLDHLIATRNGKLPTRAEIILHIDNEEHVLRGNIQLSLHHCSG
jgi:hypothetical protein